MMKTKPTILATEKQTDRVTLKMHVDADILYFSGHFNEFPLLPGVTQLDWAIHYARQLLGLTGPFQGIEVVKYQEPIFPGSQVTLSLVWDAPKQKLTFQYTSGDEASPSIHSSGKIKLGTLS